MCRRTTDDPLLSVLVREDYTLLRNMRTGVGVLDAWVDFTGDGPFEPVGTLPELFDGGLPKPPEKTRQRADIEKERTAAFDAGVALGFLAPFFAIIGIGVLTKLRARLASKSGSQLRVTVSGVTERSVSLAALSRDLGAGQIAETQGRLLTDGRRVAFAGQVVQARSVLMETLTSSGRGFNVAAGLAFAADLDAGASFHKVSKSVVRFSSPVPVTFGVRLYELLLDADRRVARLAAGWGFDVLGDNNAPPGKTPAAQQPQPAQGGHFLIDGADGSLIADL